LKSGDLGDHKTGSPHPIQFTLKKSEHLESVGYPSFWSQSL